MSTTTLQPGRRRLGLVDTRKISKPSLSRLVLVSTAAIIALVLFFWLLLWINPSRRGIGGRWIAQRGLARPWIAHQATDIEKITGAAKGTVNESDYESFPDILREHLNKAGNRPVVLYISAAGVVDDQGAVLLRDDAGVIGEPSETDERRSAISLETFFKVFQDASERYPAQSRFLIWDAGQVGSDRNLGVYANGFLPKLRSFLAENPVNRLVILGSCAPGQTSATSEFDDRSVFGYFVEQALSGKVISPNGLTVQSLSRYVRSEVALWVRNHRQGEQTPELYGDLTLDFPLPRARKAIQAAKSEEGNENEEESKRFLKRLERAWTERDAWQQRKPYRAAPRAWQRYQETLLRAERHYRAGELAEAEQTLNRLPNLATELGRVPALQSSLALLEKHATVSGDKTKLTELQAARTNITDALDQLLGGETAAEPEKATDGAPKPAASEKAAAGASGPAASEKAADGPALSKREEKQADDPEPAPPDAGAGLPNQALTAPSAKNSPTLHAKLKLRGRTDSPIARLFDAADEHRPLYPEAQLLVWADTFITRGPDRNAFRGNRGQALEIAMQTRALAEVAAASDERINRWVRPWVEVGDTARRKGQDLLFASESALPPSLDELERADEAYKVAIRNAETCEQAIDLVERLSAELPYYGEWKANRGGRLEVGLDPQFQELLDSAVELARLIHAEPSPRRTEGDPLAVRDEQIQRIKGQHAAVSEAFRVVSDDFHSQSDGGRWRDLDALLRVPLIPAETRMKILSRVGARTVAGSLAGVSEPASSSSSSGGSTSRLKKESDAYLATRSERSAGSEQLSSEDESPSDPNFWRTASGLARLELGLLEIGGAKEEAASLREVYDRACRKLGGSPFAEFAEFSERIRGLRKARLATLGEKPGAEADFVKLDAGDRTARVLALADAQGRDRVVEARIRFLRRDFARWQSLRLLEDFAPREALVLLEKATLDYGDSEALRKTVEQAQSMTRAKMLVDAIAPKQNTLDEKEGMDVSIKVGSEGTIPQGDAVAYLSYDLQMPVSVSPKNDDTDALSPTGVIVPIGTNTPADPVEFQVERTDSTPTTVTIKLEPGAFYRGQIFPKDLDDSAIDFSLTPSKEGIDVTLRQSERSLIARFGDQFKRHPGKGYLHPHSVLAYRFVINHTLERPTKVWLRYSLEGIDDSIVTRPNVKLLPGRANEELADEIDADKHELPLDKPRYLTLEVRKDNEAGRVLFKRRYPFRQVVPSQYIRVQDGFDNLNNRAFVDVWHLRSDPVSGPSEVAVDIDGGQYALTINRGSAARLYRDYPMPPPPVVWKLHVEQVLDAFKGRIDTGVAPPETEKKVPAL